MINGNISVLMISEPKLDETLPAAVLFARLCDPYRFDRNRNDGSIML